MPVTVENGRETGRDFLFTGNRQGHSVDRETNRDILLTGKQTDILLTETGEDILLRGTFY